MAVQAYKGVNSTAPNDHICVLLDLAEKNGHYNIKNHIWQQQIEEEVVVDGGGWWALTLHSTYPDADESCRLYFR